MTKEIRQYLAFIMMLLERNEPGTNWRQIEREILIRIAFYQHERLIHLLVTLSFTAFTAVAVVMAFHVPYFFWVVVLFFVLLIPYIIHYYFLENSVQKLYRQYYIIKDKCQASGSK